ncbi:MAG TPA: hypothetical protein VKA15_16615 [Isosphaeraceae bacterium]|nr:hypothetical protein [Isosphaeraceae bacterium]
MSPRDIAIRLGTALLIGAVEVETHYSVELRCQGREEAHIRALLSRPQQALGWAYAG